MKKYKFDALGVEITRRCNLKCLHCCRGDAQDLTITPEIIDTIFENADECPNWELFGGETLLAMDMLEYFINALTHSNVGAKFFSFTTNGSILNPDLVPLLAYFSESEEDRTARIRISDDPFHDMEQSKRALDYYSRMASDYHRIKVITVSAESDEENKKSLIEYVPALYMGGRAVDNLDSCIELTGWEIGTVQSHNHRIRIDGNTVKCYLQISANGNICFAQEMQDYDTMDRLSFGNILDNSLYDSIQKINSECMLSCRDTQQMEWMSACRVPAFVESNYPMQPFLHQLIGRIGESVFAKIVEAREAVHKKYPHIPVWEIINALPFPDFKYDGMKMVRKIIAQFPPFELSDVLMNIDSDLLERAAVAIDDISNDPFKARLYDSYNCLIDALKCYGKLKETVVNQGEIEKFEPMNTRYTTETDNSNTYQNSECMETITSVLSSSDETPGKAFHYLIKSSFAEVMESKEYYNILKSVYDYMEKRG